MSAENPLQIPLELSSQQLKAIAERKEALFELSQNALIPAHAGCPKPQKPEEVEVDYGIYRDEETGKHNVIFEIVGRCPTLENCFTAWQFDPVKGTWENTIESKDEEYGSFFEEVTYEIDPRNIRIVTKGKKTS